MEYVCGNIFAREMDWGTNPDAPMEGHAHLFDHARVMLRGAATLDMLNDDDSVKASTTLNAKEGGGRYLANIKAGEKHRITPVPTLELDPRALRAVLHKHGMPTDSIDAVILDASFIVQPLAVCLYSHRVPQALVERMGSHPEFDALMKRVIELGNEVHGDIVQSFDGWPDAFR